MKRMMRSSRELALCAVRSGGGWSPWLLGAATLFFSIAVVPLCLASAPSLGASLYVNGDILTMEGDQPRYAEAIVEQDGKIAFIGSRAMPSAVFREPQSAI
jgi:hypothetical protein